MPCAEDLKLVRSDEPMLVQMVTVTARTANDNRRIGDEVPMRPIEELERIAQNSNGQLLLEDSEYRELQV